MKFFYKTLICVSLLLNSTPVFAKDEDKLFPFNLIENTVYSVFDLGSIIVSGKRLNSPFGDFVANSVSSTSVVTEEDVRLSGAQNLPEAMREIPGVILSNLNGNNEEPTLDFRGFNEGQDFVFMLDGVRLNEPKSNNINFPLIPLHLMQRLEVSRGGASSLYGEGAQAGAANIVTKVPEKEGFSSKLTTLVGSFGEWGKGFEAGHRGEDKTLFLAGNMQHERGFHQNSSTEKEDFYSKLIWEPADTSRFSVSYLYADAYLDRSGSIRESLLASQGRKATERPRNFADLGTSLGILDGQLELTDSLAFSGNTFIRKTSELTVVNFATFDTFDNEQDLNTDSWGFTTQLDFSKDIFWGLTNGLLIGVDYQDYEVDQESFDRSKATLQRLSATVDSLSEKEAAGVFSKASISWSEKVGAYYGARYDDISFDNHDVINVNSNVPSAFSNWSHSVGTSYRLTEQLALSADYSQAFRSPALSDLYIDPSIGGNPALKPEESSSFDFGARWQDKTTLVTSTAFLSNVKNEIGYDPNAINPFAPGGAGQNANLGKTRRIGLESFFERWFTGWLRGRLSHTYTEATFRMNDPSNQKSGDHIPMIPRNRFVAGVALGPAAGWTTHLDMVSVSKQVLTNDLTNDRNGRRLPAYTVFDWNTLYTVGDWEFSFQVRNLLDESYETGGSLGASSGSGTVTNNFFVPAPGRSYRFTLSRYF